MVKQPVKVLVRTRPTTRFAHRTLDIRPSENRINVELHDRSRSREALNHLQHSFSFRFDGLLHNASQDLVFETIGIPSISSVLGGYNSTIFCYGQTGAGKTYTMSGPPDTDADYARRGLIPRCVEGIFEEIHARPERSFQISLSYLEIYNENLIDLLAGSETKGGDEGGNSNSNSSSSSSGGGSSGRGRHSQRRRRRGGGIGATTTTTTTGDMSAGLGVGVGLLGPAGGFGGPEYPTLSIMDLGKKNIVVRGLKVIPVSDQESALSLMFEGDTQRAICEHVLNKESSRSHVIFTLYVESRSRVESTGAVTFSKLHLVDLAGSERVKKTQSTGQTLLEAKCINKSLSFLEQVVVALSTPGRDHVPYRQSPLTHLLSDSIGGNSKTTMVANVWGEKEMIDETLSTLHFATRMMRVSNVAVVNVMVNPEQLIRQHERTIAELKRELAMHDQLKGVSQVTYNEFSEEQRVALRKVLWSFVGDEVEEVEVKNLRHVKEAFLQFKMMIRNLQHDLEVAKRDKPAAAAQPEKRPSARTRPVKGSGRRKSSGRGKHAREAAAAVAAADDGKVGVALEHDGFAVGEGIPAKGIQKGRNRRKRIEPSPSSTSTAESLESPVDPSGDPDAPEEATPPPLDRNALYEQYKCEDGREPFEGIKKNMVVFRRTKAEFRESGLKVNAVKAEIDGVKLRLTQKASQTSADEEDVVDEELQLLYGELKTKKMEYRTAYQERQRLKSELSYNSQLIAVARKSLISGFEEWIRESHPSAGAGPSLLDSDRPSSLSSPKNLVKTDDELDDGEMFEKLEEERIRNEDPQSVSYYRAFMKSRVRRARPRGRA